MKSKANKIISFSFAAIMIFSSAAISYGASKDITRTNIFYSKTKKYEYAAQKEIHQDGKTYKLKDIKYKLVADKGAETKDVKLENLTEEKAPATKSFEIDGKKVTFTLDTDATKFEKNKKEGTYVYTARDPKSFKADQTRAVKDQNGNTFTGKLESVTKGAIYRKPITIDGEFRGSVGTQYFYFANTGTLWPYNANAPVWNGYQSDILTYLNLDASAYRITGGSWTSSRVSGNTLIRTARFTGTSNVCDYTAKYVDGSDSDGYTANAVYLSPYKVKAIATYEQAGLTTMQKVLIGTGILILAIVIALILYFLKKKKREDEEGA
jgi:hypothetical protein